MADFRYASKATTQRNRSLNNKSGSGSFRSLFWASLAFIAGYLSASYYDVEHFGAWINRWIEHYASKTGGAITVATQAAPLPKPKFEFYTLLTHEPLAEASVVAAVPSASEGGTIKKFTLVKKSNTLTPVLAQSNALPKPFLNARESYIIQVASFRNRYDAEKIKASLVMKGFDVRIVVISQQGSPWYRVMMGPFATRDLAQAAQSSVARSERLQGLIRKMDV